MTEYSVLLSLVFIIPFIFSFEKQIFFIKKIHKVLVSILVVAFPYLIWDYLFTVNQIWGFSAERVSNFRIFELPIEEVLFFFIVPYALLFIFEVVNFYVKVSELKINYNWFLIIGLVFIILTILVYPKIYTFVQFIVISFLCFLIWFIRPKFITSKNFWIFNLISVIPFFIVNYFLTSIPIVWYNDLQILGFRIITIPVEDFFYHFAYTFSIISVYNFLAGNR